jgi:hypothetical protein
MAAMDVFMEKPFGRPVAGVKESLMRADLG